MAYRVSIPEHKPYVHFTIVSSVTKPLLMELIRLTIPYEEAMGIHRFLVDVRGVVSKTSPFDDYDIAYFQTSRIGLSPRVKAALLHREEDRSYDFIVTTGKNAGHQINRFTTLEAADSWLCL